MKKSRKLKFNLWERIDFLTGKKFVVCNHVDDIKMLKPYFPVGTKIISKAAGPRGAYYIMDMETLKKNAYRMAKNYTMPKPEPMEIDWSKYKVIGEKQYSNIVVHVESETGSSRKHKGMG